MLEKIEKLKRLRIARQLALEYDYVPQPTGDLEIWEDTPKQLLYSVADEYKSNSINNIDNLIDLAIKQL